MLMNGPSFYLPGYIAHDQTPSMPLVLRLEGVGAGRGRGGGGGGGVGKMGGGGGTGAVGTQYQENLRFTRL